MVFKPFHKPGDLYFVTGTIIDWKPIFSYRIYINIIIDSLHWHRANHRMKIFAFVLMDNHVHWISKPVDPYSINDNIQSFASYTAHKILKVARLTRQHDLLEVFSNNAEIGKQNKIWKNFQAKNIFTHNYLVQKMEYIHNNPIKDCMHYSFSRANYLYSSARYYDLGETPIIPIDDIFEYINRLD